MNNLRHDFSFTDHMTEVLITCARSIYSV